VLRRLALEAQNLGSGVIVPFPAKQTLKAKGFRGSCSGNHGRSSLTGEKLTCGHCGPAAKPRPSGPSCRYCGRSGEGTVCTKCEKIRTAFDAAGIRSRVQTFAIVDRPGLTGAPTIGDDELLVTIVRRARGTDQRRLALDEADERKAKRAAWRAA